jgi:hypothetical protein
MTSLRSTITKANDLSARIGHDFGDYADLIVRKAGEKQREEGLANAASQHRCSRPSDRAPTGLAAPRVDQLSEEHKGREGQPNKRLPTNNE